MPTGITAVSYKNYAGLEPISSPKPQFRCQFQRGNLNINNYGIENRMPAVRPGINCIMEYANSPKRLAVRSIMENRTHSLASTNRVATSGILPTVFHNLFGVGAIFINESAFCDGTIKQHSTSKSGDNVRLEMTCPSKGTQQMAEMPRILRERASVELRRPTAQETVPLTLHIKTKQLAVRT